MSEDPRLEHGMDILSQQNQVQASGTDKHGGYHDYLATNDADAKEGLQAEIDAANEDD